MTNRAVETGMKKWLLTRKIYLYPVILSAMDAARSAASMESKDPAEALIARNVERCSDFQPWD
jgi:hypothetical protein